MVNTVSNIDTIYVLIDVEDYEQSSYETLNILKEEKEKAKLAATNSANEKHLVSLNGLTFQILPSGSQGSSYILRNNLYEVKVAQFRSGLKNFLPIQLRISSECLWSEGLEDSWSKIYNWLVESFGNITTNKVCRVDLCTHISNVDLITDYEKCFKGNFKKRNLFYTGNQVNAITFGSRKSKSIYCRIYNKSLEIQETKNKGWFKNIWQANNMNCENVWNIEFELKSDFLRTYNINTVDDIILHLGDLWKYCTTEWLVHVNRNKTRIERCETSQVWQTVQNSYKDYIIRGLIERNLQNNMDASMILPNLVGTFTSYSAKKGTRNIDDALEVFKKDTKKYLQTKETLFENKVVEKMQFFHGSEVLQ